VNTDFELYVEAHPNVTHTARTRHAWEQAVARGEDQVAMVAAADNYGRDLTKRRTVATVIDAADFITAAGRWRDYK